MRDQLGVGREKLGILFGKVGDKVHVCKRAYLRGDLGVQCRYATAEGSAVATAVELPIRAVVVVDYIAGELIC